MEKNTSLKLKHKIDWSGLKEEKSFVEKIKNLKFSWKTIQGLVSFWEETFFSAENQARENSKNAGKSCFFS